MISHISELVELQRAITGRSNTSTTARRSAFDPSSTAKIGLVTSRPCSRSPTISSVTRVAFSVEPSTSDNGCLVPSMAIPRATTHVCSPKCTPSTMNPTRSSPDRSAESRAASAVSVCATNRRDTAEREVAVAAVSVRCPTGSSATG